MDDIKIFDGCIPSPEDARDLPLSATMVDDIAIPPEMPRTFRLDILDQGYTPECVAHTAATIEQYLKLKQNLEKSFDPHWLYAECKKQDGIPDVQGTYLRIALKILQKQGARTIGNTDENKYRIGSYAKVDDLSFEGLKKAIFLYGVVMAGFVGSNGGWRDASGVIRQPIAGEKVWGHCVALVGYKNDCLIGQNSWGTEKQNRGFFYVPKEYLPFEAWTILTDLPVVAGDQGWVASDVGAIADNTIIARLNLRETPNGQFIKTLPVGTKFNMLGQHNGIVGGHNWIRIEIL